MYPFFLLPDIFKNGFKYFIIMEGMFFIILRLIERNYWDDYDVWKGRKKNHKVEIKTPFRVSHPYYGKYIFHLILPDGSHYTTTSNFTEDLLLDESNLFFNDFEACRKFVLNYIMSK